MTKFINSLQRHVRDELALLSSVVDLDECRVLDIGCGTGDFARKLKRANPFAKVVGLEADIAQHQVSSAVRDGGVTFIHGNAQLLPFRKQSFDLIVMLKSLHHVPVLAMDTALREAAKVLSNEGLLYVSEPVFEGTFNEVVRHFHDEEVVRKHAQQSLDRAIATNEWEQVFDHHFMVPISFKDFGDFERRVVAATYSNHRLTGELRERVSALFETHMTPEGANFTRPMRARLLRKRELR